MRTTAGMLTVRLWREGEYWALTAGGGEYHLRDGRGLAHLEALLASPGVEIPALELARAAAAAGAAAAAAHDARAAAEEGLSISTGGGDAGVLLDEPARNSYRRRARELQSEIEQAESFNDPERAAGLRLEFEALMAQLGGGLGLGGRARVAGSAAERARVSVTRALRSAIRRIGECDPDLGAALDRAIRTGTLCSYTPGADYAIGVGAPDAGSRAVAVAPGGGRAPLPHRMAATPGTPFVGRAAELESVLSELERAAGGGRATVLLAADPGVGKTRLASEVARRAHAGGTTVLYGRCDEVLGMPYQPFAEALGPPLDAHPAIAQALSVPETLALGRLFPWLDATATSDLAGFDVGDRHVLFGAVSRALAQCATDSPVLVVLDDMHWADGDTTLMLRYLMLSGAVSRVTLLCTYRPTDVERESPLGVLLADAEAEEDVRAITITGLARDELETLAFAVVEESGDRIDDALLQALHEETGGNPYFATELLRHLCETGGLGESRAGGDRPDPDAVLVDLPRGVRETISRRIGRLPEEVQTVLRSGSVLGREIDVPILAALLALEEEDVLDALDHAERAGLARRVHPERAGYAFAHGLVAQTLYDSIAPGSRRRLHRAAAGALESRTEAASPHRAAEIAHHVLSGAGSTDDERVVDYARRAGDAALAALAPEEAERWYARALENLGEAAQDARCELLVALGRAQCGAGNPRFRQTLLDAAAQARELGHSDLLVRAALANSRGFVAATGRVDADRVAVLESALAAVGEGDSSERALLLSALAAELTFAGDWERRLRLSDESLAMARRLYEADTLRNVLATRFMTVWTPATLDERRANADEELAIAKRHGTTLDQFWAVHWRSITALESGDAGLARRLVAEEGVLARASSNPTALWIAAYDRAVNALIDGELDEAEREAGVAAAIAAGSGQPEALAFHVGQLLNIRFEQGRLMELEPVVAAQVDENPGIPAFRAALALALVEGDMPDRAAAVMEVDAEDGFGAFSYDSNWLVGIALYAEASARLGDARTAAMLHELLLPSQAQVVYNSATVWGSVSRYLGNLDAVLGRRDEARARLAEALALHERVGAPLWIARTKLDLGLLDDDRNMLTSAAVAAGEHGSATLAARAQAALA